MSQVVAQGQFHRTPVSITSIGAGNRRIVEAGGYYCIRPENDGWMITGHVGSSEHLREIGVDPITASERYVALLRQVAVDADHSFVIEAEGWRAIPDARAPGFRTGMAKRALTHVLNMQQKARKKTQEQFVTACNDLFSKGWPTVPIPRLPWEKGLTCQQQQSPPNR